MWVCNCEAIDASNMVTMYPTEVDSEGICKKCGFYAVFDKTFQKHGATLDVTCTIFKRNSKIPFKKMSVKEMVSFLGVKHANFSVRVKEKKPYSPKDKGVLVLFDNYESLPEEYYDLVFDKKYFVYNLEGELLGEFTDIKKVVKFTKDKQETILTNMRGETVHTKKGYIYRDKGNFNVKKYLETVKSPYDDFNIDTNWKYDIMGFEEEELGVRYEEDLYGTWKELLYS